jgi:DNA-binding transcriptional regulator GbsR (MarR family)
LKLENQQKEINRERDAAIELQTRLKTESSLLNEVKTFRSDLSSLKESNEKYNEWSEKQGRLTDTLLEK